MKMIAAIIAGVLGSAIALQLYFAIFGPSSYGPFAEFPVILVFATPIVFVGLLCFGLPYLWWEKRSELRGQSARIVLVGFGLGVLLQAVVLAVTRAHGPSVQNLVAWLFAGGIGGSISIWLLYRLTRAAWKTLRTSRAS